MSQKKYLIAEPPFFSFQGEGLYTGYPAVFIRFFGCNLSCNFGGKTEPQTINSVEDFIVPERGCDSGYAWQEEYRHLAKEMSIDEIVQEVLRLSPKNNSEFAVVYTGGEPLLHKDAIIELYDKITARPEFESRILTHIIETNGTVTIDERFSDRFFHFSISPKLKNVTTETAGINYRALRSIVEAQHDLDFILKFVLDDDVTSWNELEDVLSTLEKSFGDIRNYTYIMPLGGTKEQQTDSTIERIVLRGIRLGYKISLRTHIYVFANKVGS